jgi:hypothetical protein
VVVADGGGVAADERNKNLRDTQVVRDTQFMRWTAGGARAG